MSLLASIVSSQPVHEARWLHIIQSQRPDTECESGLFLILFLVEAPRRFGSDTNPVAVAEFAIP